MRKLNSQECRNEIDSGAGGLSFMGGCDSKNGKMILFVRDENILFENEEIGGDEWNKYREEQMKEGAEFCGCTTQTKTTPPPTYFLEVYDLNQTRLVGTIDQLKSELTLLGYNAERFTKNSNYVWKDGDFQIRLVEVKVL